MAGEPGATWTPTASAGAERQPDAMESNEFDGAFKPKEFRPPRRRRVVDDAAEEESSSPTPAPAAGSKKGWGENDDMDDEAGSAPAIRRGRPRFEEAKEPGKRNQHDDNDDDGDIPIIPDLEDETDTVARQVASAPSLKTSRIQTIEQLNRAIDTALPSAGEVGVDLGVLQAYLLPQEQLRENTDEVWDFDTEMRKLMSELQVRTGSRRWYSGRHQVAIYPSRVVTGSDDDD